jgi:tRNA-dihydrouridine synthase
MVFACESDTAARAIDGVRKIIGGEIPIIAKLTPDVTDITAIASSVVNAGADALALINTVLGMVINLETMRPHLGGKTGGLSGPAIRPVAVRAIYQVHSAMPHVPILGMGGVASGRDALELVLAGASGISIGTASFGDPMALPRVQRELQSLLIARGFSSFKDAIGYLKSKGKLSQYNSTGINDFKNEQDALFAFYHANAGVGKRVSEIKALVNKDTLGGFKKAMKRIADLVKFVGSAAADQLKKKPITTILITTVLTVSLYVLITALKKKS